MSKPKQISMEDFSALLSGSGEWSRRCMAPSLPPPLAGIEKMNGYITTFFSGSLANPDGKIAGQLDAFRDELRSAYGDSDRVKKYSFTFVPSDSGNTVTVFEKPPQDVERHHDYEMQDEFLRQFVGE